MLKQLQQNDSQVPKAKPNSMFINYPMQFQTVSNIGGNALGFRVMSELSQEQSANGSEVIQRLTAEDIMVDVINNTQDKPVSYEDMNIGITRESSDPDITFGVELEVVHENITDQELIKIVPAQEAEEESVTAGMEKSTGEILRDASVQKAQAEGLTPAMWTPTFDATIQGGAGIEWVSSVFHISPECWEAIKKMCQIINDYKGVINDTCSEHIHVGHAILEGNKEKFNGLFKMYCAFQDVINIFARCSRGEMRSGADDYAAEMSISEGKTNSFYKVNGLHSLRFPDNRVNLPADRKPYENAWNEITNMFGKSITDPGMDVILRNVNSNVYKDIDSMVQRVFGLELNSFFSVEKLYDNIQDLAKKISVACSFYDIFQIDPFNITNRQKAINITQNFDSAGRTRPQIPTVEFRRFNGVKDANIVQANILLTTLMMEAAAKNTNITHQQTEAAQNIDGLITQSANLPLKNKAELLIDFLTDNNEIKHILVHAYLANAKEDER